MHAKLLKKEIKTQVNLKKNLLLFYLLYFVHITCIYHLVKSFIL